MISNGKATKLGQHALTLENRIGHDIWTIPAMLQARTERSSDASALWKSGSPDGTWHATSWREYRDVAASIAAGLKDLGIAPGERVGIMAPSCQHWDLVQMGVLAAQAVVVGLDPQDLDENLNVVAQSCGLAGLIVAHPSWLARFGIEARERLRFVIHFQATGNSDQGITYDSLLQLAAPHLEHTWHSAQPDDPATIIFTSGTTGAPKGIQYTHRQICSAVASILEAFPDIDEASHLVCWLPLSNMFQRMINMLAIGCGAQTYYVEDPREVMHYVGSAKPHVFIGVPRFYEKLYAGMIEEVRQGPAWRQGLVEWALRVGKGYAKALRCGRRPNLMGKLYHRLADYLVLRRFCGVMGSNLRYMVSGSAPMSLWLLEHFHAMGLLVLEAYGMSENAIPIAINQPNAYRLGTVGRPMSGCEVRLADDGELLVRGPGVISSYYGEGQAGLLDASGYLASGDYATIDADGFVTLIGRKSEIFKTSTGRRIAPAAIESFLSQVPSVENSAVFGADRPFLVAVVSISAKLLEVNAGAIAEQSGLIGHCERILPEIVRCLAPLPVYKRPAGLVVTTRPFTVEGGEVTTNLKLRRRNIAEKYSGELQALNQRLEGTRERPVLEAANVKEDIVLCSL